MFKRPEELIMLVLAVLWVILTYFLCGYFGVPAQTSLLIAALTLIWAAASFSLWQRNYSRLIWPVLLGLLVACWWPFLDWYAVKDIVVPGMEHQAIIVNKPWYAGWTFKFILALIPICAGYFFKWKNSRKSKTSPAL